VAGEKNLDHIKEEKWSKNAGDFHLPPSRKKKRKSEKRRRKKDQAHHWEEKIFPKKKKQPKNDQRHHLPRGKKKRVQGRGRGNIRRDSYERRSHYTNNPRRGAPLLTKKREPRQKQERGKKSSKRLSALEKSIRIYRREEPKGAGQ